MEDALVLSETKEENKKSLVLILVLMEDALVQGLISLKLTALICLNPCFNGRCTSTVWIKLFVALLQS